MIIELISAVVILAIAILFFNPGHLTMPDTIVSIMIVTMIVAYLIFAAYLLKEKASDERDSLHIMAAGRFSYLIGVAVLILGIINQGIHHDIDPWLVIVLCAMVLSKLLFRIYSRFKM